MIAISILDVNDKEKVKNISETNTDYIHLDVMDGKFVQNKTLPYEEDIKRLEFCNKRLDVHLMVKDIKTYIDEYKILNPEFITFHVEATGDITNTIKYIKNICKVGISIKPDTSVDIIKPYLKDVDLVLVMSVEPGMGGQKFMDSSAQKISELRKLKQENGYNYLIEVDGGINDKTIHIANADISVVGSFVTKSDNYQEQIKKLV